MANSRVQEFKKDLILQTARELFTGNCFEAVTVDDIAQAAGFSKATLYVFFSSKEDILYNVLRDGLEHLISNTQNIKNNSPDSISALESVISNYSGFRDYARLIPAFIRRKESEATKPEWSEEISRLVQIKIELLADILAWGMQEHQLTEQEPILLARILDAMIRGIYQPSGSRAAPDYKKDLKICKNIIFHGIKQKEEERK
jgi:AcrR family transcriptional regulator